MAIDNKIKDEKLQNRKKNQKRLMIKVKAIRDLGKQLVESNALVKRIIMILKISYV